MSNGIQVIRVQTESGSTMMDITGQVMGLVRDSGQVDGLCVLFMPHTTSALTLNEHWDPDVRRDLLMKMDELVAYDTRFRHCEGNSAAHIKASLFDASLVLMVHQGELQLGQWQGIYLVDWDGPRLREVWVTLLDTVARR